MTRGWKTAKYSIARSQEGHWGYLTRNRSEDGSHPLNRKSSSSKRENVWVAVRVTFDFFKFIISSPSQKAEATSPRTYRFFARLVIKGRRKELSNQLVSPTFRHC